MILHISSPAEWAADRERGEIRPDSLDDVGFVHCSDPGSVHLPANLFYAGRTDLLLLVIDPDGLPVRWEPGKPEHPTGVWFPHVYGPVPVDSVVRVLDFPPDADGVLRLPKSF
ncbi:DUF952 domain-containing protein [Umezawaea sp. Da 62-37]|uniref:DUF952 domain-containing protein n=1 Tax=Umezawaea sp. Da 62-37 TaxID=3075927 RepID=UPI0028F7074B|nr:DUF952 domain-containing protein [Umezawaea sp. Da 62-37]WNV91523.1 DUF952 domain-containing protein [Umezawaea sp. Da 62-37]